jgi:methyl-accepting chemotaxis protein
MDGKPRAPQQGGNAADQSGFFAHHGFWAPGVRLFRNLGFRAKAALISLMFILPLAVIGSAYLREAQAERQRAARELAGVAFARDLIELLDRLEQQRLASVQAKLDPATPLQPLARETEAQLERVVTAYAAVSDLVSADALDVVRANAAKAAEASSNPLAAYKRQSQVIEAAQVLLQRTVDGTGLGIDPGLDTRYLIQVGISDLPRAVEAVLAQADLALAAAAGAPSNLVSLQMAHPRAIGLYLDGQVRESIDLLAAAEPELASLLAYAPTQEAMTATSDAASALLESADAGTIATLLQRRAELVQNGARLRQAVLEALETRLTARIAGGEAELLLLLGLLAASLLIVSYLFVSFARVMQGGLREVERHLRAMTAGDLTGTPRPWGRDEAASLMLVLREMQDWLRGIVAQVRESSRDIDARSGSIAAEAGELAAGSQHEAEQLEDASSAMERIGGVVRSTAERASNARDSGRANVAAARRSGEVIRQVIDTMQGIHGSSKQIGDITAVIDEIAFQTNVLALNAAVEAARAGDSGRGFAVVAAEVRQLALRSATAAREIKELVGSTIARVDGGVEVVQRAGDAIGEMLAASEQVDAQLSEFARSATEQADGVLEVGRAVAEITAQTRAGVERVTASQSSAMHLQEQAQLLSARVDRFRLPDRSDAAARLAGVAAAAAAPLPRAAVA